MFSWTSNMPQSLTAKGKQARATRIRGGRRPRKAARGAVFVEAIIVIVFMVLMWQLMWMVLSHYQARQHGAQQAREDVWQWGMRDQCAKDKTPETQDQEADRSPETDYDDATNVDLDDEDPCNSQPDCDAETDLPGGSDMGDVGTGVGDIEEFKDMAETKSNLAIVTVQRSYFSPIEGGNKQVPSQLSIECNPELQTDDNGFDDALSNIGTRLFGGIKAVL